MTITSSNGAILRLVTKIVITKHCERIFLVMASLALDRCDVPRIILKRHLELPSNSVCRNSYLINLGAPASIHFPATSENTGKSSALFEDVASESGVPSIISSQLVS